MDDGTLLLLERYFADQCTSAEREQLAEWIAADPSRQGEVDVYRRLIERARAARAFEGDPQATLRQLEQVIAEERSGAKVFAAPVPVFSRFKRKEMGGPLPQPWPRGVGGGVRDLGSRRFVAAAASAITVAVGLGVSVGVWVHRTKLGAAVGREYATAAGQRLSVMLVDGTQLMLAPASTLRIAANYGRGPAARVVALEGEAYFAVTHDAARPFVVRAHGAVARDVGTGFDVRAYREDPETRVAVAEGAVAVSREESTAVPGLLSSLSAPLSLVAQLRARDVATIVGGRVAVTHGVDVTALMGWMQGRLVFTATPLRDVTRELSRTFDLTITLADPTLGRELITGNFDNQTADAILGDITAVIGAQYERQGHRVAIRRGTPAAATPADQRPAVQTARALGVREWRTDVR
jgi:transmembrane sensor